MSDTKTMDAAQRRIIQKNVEQWQRQRRRRGKAIEKRTFNSHFNNVAVPRTAVAS